VIRVHIADDHPVVREGLSRMLAATPDIVVAGESSDGESAVRAVEAGGFDILMLDLTLPGISGFDVLARVRTLRPELKVLILTIHAERHYAVRVLRNGAHGYLTKDSPPAAILDAVRVIARGEKYVPSNVAASLIDAPSSESPHAQLSERELAVLIAIGQGRTPSEIAGALDLSNSTVSTHIARIRAKLDARSIGDLVRYAVKAGLVE
jgi:two-component system, NarL family, invasion response regulator UvrY